MNLIKTIITHFKERYFLKTYKQKGFEYIYSFNSWNGVTENFLSPHIFSVFRNTLTQEEKVVYAYSIL